MVEREKRGCSQSYFERENKKVEEGRRSFQFIGEYVIAYALFGYFNKEAITSLNEIAYISLNDIEDKTFI